MAESREMIAYDDQELMIRVLYALNSGKEMSHGELTALLKCDQDRLETRLKFLRENMLIIAKTTETLNVKYRISKRGIGILYMIEVWFRAKL